MCHASVRDSFASAAQWLAGASASHPNSLLITNHDHLVAFDRGPLRRLGSPLGQSIANRFLIIVSSSADPRMRATFATAKATMVIGIHQRIRRLAAGFSVSWLVFAFMVLIDRPFIQVNAYTVVKSSFKRSPTSNTVVPFSSAPCR